MRDCIISHTTWVSRYQPWNTTLWVKTPGKVDFLETSRCLHMGRTNFITTVEGEIQEKSLVQALMKIFQQKSSVVTFLMSEALEHSIGLMEEFLLIILH